MFADDVKLLSESGAWDTVHSDPDTIFSCSGEIDLCLIASKCIQIHLGLDHCHLVQTAEQSRSLDYHTKCNIEIVVDENRSISPHVDVEVKKVIQMSNVVRRFLKFLSPKKSIRLFMVFVKPRLEYCIQA